MAMNIQPIWTASNREGHQVGSRGKALGCHRMMNWARSPVVMMIYADFGHSGAPSPPKLLFRPHFFSDSFHCYPRSDRFR